MDLNESDAEEIDFDNKDLFNYKGYFVENDIEDIEPKFFEYGAHFSYQELCKRLEILKLIQIEEEKKNDKKEKKTQINKKKINYKERNNTKDKTNDNNFNTIMKIFAPKIKSRNIGEIDNDNNNQKELTFIPKIKFKNNFTIKKDEKINQSINSCKYNSNRLNYKRINNNQKNIKYSINNSNKKINLTNKTIKIKLKQIKFKTNFGNYIIAKNKMKKNICQQIKLISKNKNLNKNNNYSYITNSHKFFPTQMNNIKSKSIKDFKLKDLSFNTTIKENINIKGINNTRDIDENKCGKNGLNFNYNSKKNEVSKKKVNNLDLKLDKISINSCNSYKNKISSPLDYLLNDYKWKQYKYCHNFSKKILTILPIYNSICNFSTKSNDKRKYYSYKNILPIKLNNYSSILYSRKNIFSITEKSLLNNKTIEKIKLNKEKINEKEKGRYLTQSSFINKNNEILRNISLDCLNKRNNKNINKINGNNKKSVSHNRKENFNNLFNKKEKKSRNIDNNFLFENTSSINITEYRKSKNKYNNLLNLNKTYHNKNLLKINKKQFNLYKTIINKKKNIKKNKKIFIGFPFSSKKRKSFMISLDNNHIAKNFNSTGYLEKKNKKNNNNLYIYRLINNNSNKKSNNSKDYKYKSKSKDKNYLEIKKIIIRNNNISINSKRNKGSYKNLENFHLSNISNKVFRINNIKKKTKINLKNIGTKTNQFLDKKKDDKNKVNISININNSNIIYNKVINNKNNKNYSNILNNDKNPSKANNKLIMKTLSIQQNKNLINNSKLRNVNLIDNNDKNIKFSEIKKYNIKNEKKIKLINIHFPKSKFLNIINNNNKK